MEEAKKPNGSFTEISRGYYVQLLECVPPKNFSRPYCDGGWFIMGEAYMHDRNMKPWHHLCFRYDGKCYWGLRPIDISAEDIRNQINMFAKSLHE